jgi:hypothetical protein
MVPLFTEDPTMRHTVRFAAVVVMFATLSLGLAGCSSFDTDYKAELAATGYNAPGITGVWVGTWHSDATGHSGKLRAIVTQTTPDIYNVRYDATYGKVVPLTFEYSVNFPVQKQGENYTFTGSADLGGMCGGIYEYRGHASPTEFLSTYHAKQDYGTYTLHRPEPPKPAAK